MDNAQDALKPREVPRVNLLDPEVEPGDWEIDALLASVAAKATEKSRQAHEKLMADLKDAIKRAK